jgi:rhodanese-related sulfurtransferase
MMKTQSQTISPKELYGLLTGGHRAFVLDVRTPAEYAAAHVPGARLAPLDKLDAGAFLKTQVRDDKPIYVLCQGGARARRAIEKFQRAGFYECVLVEGGTQAWMEAGLPVNRSERKVLPLMQQVQLTIGLVSGMGAGLALAVNKWFALIPLATGCGLLVAGLTGFCGLAMLLAKMPWNRDAKAQSGCSC